MLPHQRPFTTLVVLRDEMIRRGLVSMLRDIPEVSDDIRECTDITEAAASLDRYGFDVVILGSEATEDLLLLNPAMARRSAKMLVLLHDFDDNALSASARLRVDGFLMASGLTLERLTTAMKSLRNGEMPLPLELTWQMMERFQRPQVIESHPISLTPRESQTLHLLVEGLSNKQVATRLGISQHSAKRHVANVLAKLNCPNRTLAAAYAVRVGLVNGNGAGPRRGNPATFRARPTKEEATWGSS